MLKKSLLFLLIMIQLVFAVCLPTLAETQPTEVVPSAQTVTTFGRTYYAEDGLHFNWTNSGFAFTFTGTAVSAQFTSSTTLNQAFLRVYVDDVPLERDIALRNGTSTVALASDLEDTAHTIRVVKRTENGWGGMVLVDKLLVTGTMGTPPKNPSRVIEVIGDSITCGYGNMADRRVMNTYQSNRQDGITTFATMAAAQFNAQCNVVAKSGIGFGCNNGGGKTDTMLDAYAYTDYFNLGTETQWDFDANPADVVIIALGTNDTANGDGADYEAKALAMLQLVREKNPDAYIIWAYGMMTASRGDTLMQICNELNDPQVTYHALTLMNTATDGSGDAGHPSMTTHEKNAEGLAQVIAEMTGWEIGSNPDVAAPVVPTPTDVTPGDVNGDTKVDASDALLILKYAVGKQTLTDDQILVADVSGDQKINAEDALLILKFAVGKLTVFPVQSK